MDMEFLKVAAGAGGIATVLVALINGIWNFIKNRMEANREDDLDDRSWVETYRTYVEEHLVWDNDMRADVIQLRAVVDDLRKAVGSDPPPYAWPPIKPAPKLFPRRGGGSTNDAADSVQPR